ncbi:MAG: amino acid deaminase [Azospirillaceae bacterium]
MDLEAVRASRVDGGTKGLPPGLGGMALGEVGRQGWSLLAGDLPLPAAVLRKSALDNNSAWMRAFLGRFGAVLAPHGKTTMAPQLFDLQLADGAWAITVATVQQFEVCRRFGVPRILIANQVVGRAAIDALFAALADPTGPEVLVLADSVEGVRALAEGAGRAPAGTRPLDVLVEGGYAGGRTGQRSLDGIAEVARAVAEAAPGLRLAGIEGYEGNIHGADQAETDAAVDAFLDFLVTAAETCDAAGLFTGERILLSAGGSGFFDLVARRFARAALSRPVELVVRSGCYLTHDSHHFEAMFEAVRRRTPEAVETPGRLEPAIEIWAAVQSTPEPGLALLTAGKRDISYDIEMPFAIKWFRAGHHDAPVPLDADYRIAALNDQHAYLRAPADHPLRYGDMVCLGISHPCTTFDKWDVLCVVDDAYRVVDAVRTYF